MNYRNYFFLILFTSFIIISCKKDFLDVPNKSTVLRQVHVVDLKTTGEFLNGIYISLAMYFTNNTGLAYPEVIADNIRPKDISSFVFTSCYNWNQQADSKKNSVLGAFDLNANGGWISGYSIARQCSFVLEAAEKYKDQDNAKADSYKGQALAIRAYVHFMLVNIFAQSYSFTPGASHPGVPYVRISDWSQPESRKSVKEVYDLLVADLNEAINLLPASIATPAKLKYSLFSRNAAKALLARIYLFKNDWTAAKGLAREIATNVPLLSAANYPSKLFTNDETEALFQLPPSGGANAPDGAGSYFTNFSANWFSGSGYQLVSTGDMAAILRENPNDKRYSWVVQNGTNWDIKKFPLGVVPGISNQARSYFQTILRSSEMYLTAAECYANLNNEDSARFFLDEIRKRAYAAAAPTLAGGTALLDSIYKERRKELCFEGWRMFDIQRWKQPVTRADALSPTIKLLPYGSDKAIAPIPILDVELYGMPQNNGYQN